MKTRIRGSYVIGYEDGDHVVWPKGEVVFEDDSILFVGRGYAGEVDRELDAAGQVVSPGFIDLDALVDFDHGILDVAVPKAGQGFVMDGQRFRTQDRLSRAENQTRHRLSYAQLISNGITTGMPIAGDAFRGWAETFEEMEDGAQIAREMGMRMYLGPSYRSYAHAGARRPDARGAASFAEALRFVERFEQPEGLIRTFLSPCQLMQLDEATLRETFRFGEAHHIPVRLHVGESREELAWLEETFGKTPVEYLADIGALRPGVILPHVIYTRPNIPGKGEGDAELRLLAEGGATVLHCPIAEAHGGLALYGLSRYLASGVHMALGTDTHPADMLQNMNFAWNLTRLFDSGGVVPKRGSWAYRATEADLFRMATLGGAAALGRDDLGRLCPGAKADIITINISGIRTLPVEDPVRTLVMNTTGADVTHVFINGRQLLQDKTLLNVDVERLADEAQKGFDHFRQDYSWFDAERRPPDALFPPAFPSR